MVSNNFMEIQMGEGVFELGNPEGRGAEAVLEIQVDGGVKKPCLPSWGCGFFSGITHCISKYGDKLPHSVRWGFNVFFSLVISCI